jgi:hypothetical protein
MKIVGIILILLGVGLFIFQGIRGREKEKVLNIGPVEISKQVQRSDNQPLFIAGGIAVVAGLILVIAARKKVISR